MGAPIALVEIPNRDRKTTSCVYVDKKGSIIDPPKWLNEKRKNPYAGRRSFIVPDVPWRCKCQK